MAVRLDANNDFLSRTTNLIDFNADYTAMVWFKLDTGTLLSSYPALISLTGSGSDGTNEYEFLGTNSSGTTLQFGGKNGGTTIDNVCTTAYSAGVWNHATLVRSGSSLIVYLNGIQDDTDTLSVSGRASSLRLSLGRFDTVYSQWDGWLAHFKAWSRALTAEEIAAEYLAIRPLNPTSLTHWSPLLNNSAEYGTGSWTELGTLSWETGPPISWGDSVKFIGSVVSSVPSFSFTTTEGSDSGAFNVNLSAYVGAIESSDAVTFTITSNYQLTVTEASDILAAVFEEVIPSSLALGAIEATDIASLSLVEIPTEITFTAIEGSDTVEGTIVLNLILGATEESDLVAAQMEAAFSLLATEGSDILFYVVAGDPPEGGNLRVQIRRRFRF